MYTSGPSKCHLESAKDTKCFLARKHPYFWNRCGLCNPQKETFLHAKVFFQCHFSIKKYVYIQFMKKFKTVPLKNKWLIFSLNTAFCPWTNIETWWRINVVVVTDINIFGGAVCLIVITGTNTLFWLEKHTNKKNSRASVYVHTSLLLSHNYYIFEEPTLVVR